MLDFSKKCPASPVRLPAEDRRSTPRYCVSADGEMIDMRSGTRISGRTSDLSKGGCYLDCISLFPVGTSVRIRVAEHHRAFKACAKVVSGTHGLGMGVMFTAVEPEQATVLDKWISELDTVAHHDFEPLLPENHNGNGASSPVSAHDKSYILGELILTLMRKQVLTDAEGKSFLQKLLLGDHR
jgi:hypothetical protein